MAVAYASNSSQAGGFKSGAQNIAVPSSGSNAANDVMWIFIYNEATGDNPTVTGFTMLTAAAASNHNFRVGWKRLTANDTGNYSITYDGSGAWREAVCIKVTGAVTSGNPYDVTPASANSSTNVTASPNVAVTTATANDLLIHAASNFNGGAWTPPSGFTERFDASTGINVSTVIQVAAGASGNKSATCAGSERSCAWLIPVKPAGGASITGAISDTFTLTATAVGLPTVKATIASTFGLTATAVGTPTVKATIATTFTLTATAVGHRVFTGAISTTFTLTASTLGFGGKSGTISTTLGFSATALGFMTRRGEVSTTFTGPAVSAVGTRLTRGTAASTFGFISDASGATEGVHGVIADTFTLTATAAGTRRNRGATISTTFTLTAALTTWDLQFPLQRSMRYRLELCAEPDQTAHPDTYAWMEVTKDLYMRAPVECKAGSEDEQSESQSYLKFVLRNDESRCVEFLGQEGRYTVGNVLSDLYPAFDLGCAWRFSIDTGGVWDIQAVGFMTSNVPAWPANSSRLPLVAIEAYGRIVQEQVGEVSASAASRTIRAAGPTSWAALEDTGDGTLLAVGAGNSPATVNGAVGLGTTGIEGSAGGIDFTEGGRVRLPCAGTTGLMAAGAGWEFELAFRILELPASNGDTVQVRVIADAASPLDTTAPHTAVALTWHDTLSAWVWALIQYKDNGNWSRYFWTDDEAWNRPAINVTYNLRVVVWNNGGSKDYRLFVDGVDAIGFTSGGTHSTTPAYPVAVELNTTLSTRVAATYTWDGLNTFMAAQLAYFGAARTSWAVGAAGISPGTAPPVLEPNTTGSSNGFKGEMSHERAQRLAAEDGVPFTTAATISPSMGPQPPGALIPLMRECEVTGRAILDDHLGYLDWRSIDEMYNQVAAMEVDGSNREIYTLQPYRDSQKFVNDVTATCSWNSATARVTDDDSIAARGRWQKSITVNVDDPITNLYDQAGWAVHEGTAPGYRVPQFIIRPDVATQLIEFWREIRLGDRVDILHPPRQYGDVTISEIVRGWEQRFGGRRGPWDVVINASPYRHDVAYGRLDPGDDPDDPYIGWADWSNMELVGDVDSTDTAMLVYPGGGDFADDPGFRIVIDGITWTVDSMTTPAFLPAFRLFQVTRVADQPVRGHTSGASITLHESDAIIPAL